jgi:type I restriction enzyme S subunit
MNKTLEDMAMALYKHYFVDFDFPCLPSDYRPSGQVNMDALKKVCSYRRVGGLPVPDGKSWFVYVLECRSSSDDTQLDGPNFYKGITNDLYRRFYEHYTGIGAKWTKLNKPKRVIHWERFDTQEEAAKREKELKTGYGRTWLKRQFSKLTEGSPAPKTQLRTAGEFVDSELGEIPVGWEVKRLGDIINSLSKGTTPRKKDVDGLDVEIPFLKVKDINDDGSIKYSAIENIPKEIHEKQLKRSILEVDDILFSIAGTIGRVSIVPKQLDNSNCNQALAFIRLKNKKSHLGLIYFWLKFHSTQSDIKSSIVQGVQANVSLTVLKDLKLVLPDHKNLEVFSLEMRSFLGLMISNRMENQTLTNIRDTLLPKLISGEVRVKDMEQSIAKVV